MKKILFFISIFSAIFLLFGCVSIPLTDGGTLEISGDGLTVISADNGVAGKDENPVVEKEEKEEKEEKDFTDIVEDEEIDGEEANIENDAVELEGTELGFGGCANEFYLVVNRLPKGLPIPPCTYVRHLEVVEDEADNKRMIIAHYEDYGFIKEVHEAYKTFLEGEGYTIVNNSIEGDVSELTVAGKGIKLSVTNREGQPDELTTEIFYSENPIKKYKVVDSMINWSEEGYGECADEYYTLLSVLSDDFPLPECARIGFLQIENYDSVRNGAATYEVDRFWTEEFDAYEKYAEANNYTITRSETFTTHGELEFENGDALVSITTTKMSMEKTEIYINSSVKIGE